MMKNGSLVTMCLALLTASLWAGELGSARVKFVGSLINTHAEDGSIARLYWDGSGARPTLTMDIPKSQQFDIPLEILHNEGGEIVFQRSLNRGAITYRGRLEGDHLVGIFGNDNYTWGSFAFSRMQSAVIKGAQVPPFQVPLLDGGSLKESDLTGKYVLYNFWSTTCPPCVKKMKQLHQINEAYDGEQFAMVSISLDPTAKAVEVFRAGRWPMPWLNVQLSDRRNAPMVKAFEVSGTPSTYLVSPDGKILAKGPDLEGANMKKTLERLLPQGGKP